MPNDMTNDSDSDSSSSGEEELICSRKIGSMSKFFLGFDTEDWPEHLQCRQPPVPVPPPISHSWQPPAPPIASQYPPCQFLPFQPVQVPQHLLPQRPPLQPYFNPIFAMQSLRLSQNFHMHNAPPLPNEPPLPQPPLPNQPPRRPLLPTPPDQQPRRQQQQVLTVPPPQQPLSSLDSLDGERPNEPKQQKPPEIKVNNIMDALRRVSAQRKEQQKSANRDVENATANPIAVTPAAAALVLPAPTSTPPASASAAPISRDPRLHKPPTVATAPKPTPPPSTSHRPMPPKFVLAKSPRSAKSVRKISFTDFRQRSKNAPPKEALFLNAYKIPKKSDPATAKDAGAAPNSSDRTEAAAHAMRYTKDDRSAREAEAKQPGQLMVNAREQSTSYRPPAVKPNTASIAELIADLSDEPVAPTVQPTAEPTAEPAVEVAAEPPATTYTPCVLVQSSTGDNKRIIPKMKLEPPVKPEPESEYDSDDSSHDSSTTCEDTSDKLECANISDTPVRKQTDKITTTRTPCKKTISKPPIARVRFILDRCDEALVPDEVNNQPAEQAEQGDVINLVVAYDEPYLAPGSPISISSDSD